MGSDSEGAVDDVVLEVAARRLVGKVAVITGAGSGIGQAMADSGVYLNGGETGILAGNVAGGAKQGAVFDNDFLLEVDLDMFNDSAAIAPASTWGARISVPPTLETYLRAGVHEDDPYPDPLFNNAGLPLPLDGGTALNDQGRMSIHAMFQQMIWRPDLSETRRGLTIFGGAMFGSNQSEIRQYYQAGLSDQGPFASHPHDSINFLAMYQVFNQRLVENQTLLANQGDYAGTMNKGETDFELNYLWQIGAGVSVQPFVEYIIHPDQIGFATPNPRPPSSTTLGMQVAIALPDSLGLPVFVRKN